MKFNIFRIMKRILFFLFYCSCVLTANAQQGKIDYLSSGDLEFLRGMTKDVVESSRVYPNQSPVPGHGKNNTGNILIRPGGRDCYPAFWIRDYVMSLECGHITVAEQKHMLLLTAATQCDQTWITKGGSMVPLGAIADHVRFDNAQPVYFPGTYDEYDQGSELWGKTPPYSDQFFFIHQVWYYTQKTGDDKILNQEINGIHLIDRLEMAYAVPPTRRDSVIVFTSDDFRGVDFGFRDAIRITGNLCFPSVMKYRASLELGMLFEKLKQPEKSAKYKQIAQRLKKDIPAMFSDQRGMLMASTGISRQADVWSTALAVYFGILEGEQKVKTCRFLSDAYEKKYLSDRGNIRHVLTCDDFDEVTAWQSTGVEKNRYQNGAYWGTATGWVCYAIAQVNPGNAKKLAQEYVDDLRKNDFRKGKEFGAPYECFFGDEYSANPVYLTTVACPLIVFDHK